MKESISTSCGSQIKRFVFDYISIVDLAKPNNVYLLLLISILQLAVLPYFYFHPHYSFLQRFPLIVDYLKIQQNYFMHLTPFSIPIFTLLNLSFYPFVMVLVFLIKMFGQIRILVIAVQVAIFFMPFSMIKIVVETANCVQNGGVMLVGLLLSFVSLMFGAVVLYLLGKIYRYLEIPIIFALFFGGNQYIIIGLLAIRLAILFYLQLSKKSNLFLGLCFQCSLFIQLVSLIFVSADILNYIGFSILVASSLVFGMYMEILQINRNKNIYDLIDAMEEEQGKEFQVIKMIEEHQIQCRFVNCHCHGYLQWNMKQLKDWVYKYEEQRLKKKNTFAQRLQYSRICVEKYDYKLNGLIRVYQYDSNSIQEQYQVSKMSKIFENNLRKQDKNYKHGQAYLNIHEEEQLLNENLSQIIHMIKHFWELISNFDGSTKFLTLILNISRAIFNLQQKYQMLLSKYDDEIVNLKYMMDLFKTIILNEKVSEEDEITVPQPITYLITAGTAILKANNNFALFTNRPIEHLIGSSYLSFVPEIYRDPHKIWTEEYVEKIGDYQTKNIDKSFAKDSFEIQQVQMNHKILPRFMNGLEIFTSIQYSNKNDSFVIIAEKESLFIKNIQSSFYELTRFRINQRNIKLLQQMSLYSIFENISLDSNSHAAQQTTLTSTFAEDHTKIRKKNQKTQKRTGKKSLTNQKTGPITLTQKSKVQVEQDIFCYEILPNIKKEDPYLKIKFTPKNNNKMIIQSEISSDSNKIDNRASDIQEVSKSIKYQEQSEQFCLPVYMLLLFVGVHFLAIFIFRQFREGLTTVDNRYQFYVAYDQTILFSKNITVGSNQVDQLQNLWIKGFGNFSQSFNAFLWVADPYFGNYVHNTVSIDFHNALFTELQLYSQHILQKIQLFKLILMAAMLAALGVYFIDFILSLRYIFKIEKKVGDLLLQFIKVDQTDIIGFQNTLDNFLVNILNENSNEPKQRHNMPLQTAEQSALELLRGTPNSSLVNYGQDTDCIVQKKTSQRRSASSLYGDSQKMSLSQIKLDFIEYNQPSRPVTRKRSKLASSNFDEQSLREDNILFFQQKYGSCEFVLRTNARLFLILVVALLLVCGLIIAVLFMLYTPAQQYHHRLKLMECLYQSKIILYKSLTEISMSNYTLKPETKFSEELLYIESYLQGMMSKQYQSFSRELNTSLRGDVCQVLNHSAICGGNAPASAYGLTIIAQQIQQYFRQKNSQAITVTNTENSLIAYSQALLDTLIVSYTAANDAFHGQLESMELTMIVVGSLAVFLGLVLNYFSLKQFRNRIEDSKSLLKIIPLEIRNRHIFMSAQTQMAFDEKEAEK